MDKNKIRVYLGIIILFVISICSIVYLVKDIKVEKVFEEHKTTNKVEKEKDNDPITEDYKVEPIELVSLDKKAYVQNGYIVFPDPNLEKAIIEALELNTNKVSLTAAKNATKLIMENKNISSLEGLEYFTGVTTIQLNYNNVRDLTPISKIYVLKNLFIEKNLVTDITPITKLRNIEYINISYNQIKDISGFKTMSRLGTPTITNNPIENYDTLANDIDRIINNDDNIIISYTMSYVQDLKLKQKQLFNKNHEAYKAMETWIKENIKDNQSDLEKEYLIINHIKSKLSLDKETSSDDLYTTYVEGKSNREGYALVFNYLCNLAGLENTIVFNNSLTRKEMWNLVKIDNVYYQVDLSENSYDYVNVSSKTMNKLHDYKYHIFNEGRYPSTDKDMDKKDQKKYQK